MMFSNDNNNKKHLSLSLRFYVQTPSGQHLPSDTYSDGHFVLWVPNPVPKGTFRCTLPASAATLGCLSPGAAPPAAALGLDATEARVTLLEARAQVVISVILRKT